MTERIRTVVVDDSALFRHVVRDVLREIPGVSIVGNAENGLRALEVIGKLNPDVVTLDVEMPDMNGIQVLRELKRHARLPKVIMVSRLTEAGAQVTTDALLEGAFDFVLKPVGRDVAANRRELLEALKQKFMASTSGLETQTATAGKQAHLASRKRSTERCDVVLIGTSTGGPDALRQVLTKLPADLSVPILVVQHMPPEYTATLAQRLNDMCALRVLEATDRMSIQAGHVLIAPGGKQMQVIRRDERVFTRITNDPPEHGTRPSVDYLFRSAVNVYDGNVLAVIMTGMGRDGVEGCRELKRHNGQVVAQHSDGCVVYGMPKGVIDEGLADIVSPLDRIATEITRRLR